MLTQFPIIRKTASTFFFDYFSILLFDDVKNVQPNIHIKYVIEKTEHWIYMPVSASARTDGGRERGMNLS